MLKTIKFYTLGCKVNQYETQEMREQFLSHGFSELEDETPAQFYVINTCTVTHKADSQSLSLIRRARKENPKSKIIVTGCLTEMDAGLVNKQSSGILVFKNREKDKIYEKLMYWLCHSEPTFAPLSAGSGRRISTQAGFFTSFRMTENSILQQASNSRGISYFKGHTRAFLKIQDGCNNFCSYCKVPLVRGKSYSKPLVKIIDEARMLVRNGHKEIVLTGVCLGAYGKDFKPKIDLVKAIEALETIDGLFRIRLSSIEVSDVSAKLIYKIAHSTKLCHHLHIPLQSADAHILKNMKRNYTPEEYLTLIKHLRKLVPNIALGTDVLLGFPGETENNFGNTLNMIKKINPLKVHIFSYSKREGTLAARSLQDAINPEVLKLRALKLQEAAELCRLNYTSRFLDKSMDVLIEGPVKDKPGFMQGYTVNYIEVLVRGGKELVNRIISLRLKEITSKGVLAMPCFSG